jgi:hypothetical protein
MLDDVIEHASDRLDKVVISAGERIQENIEALASEVHNQRQLTSEQIIVLIDYAAAKFSRTIDERLAQAKVEASGFFTEKVNQIKVELEDAAIKSRKTLYANIAISVFGALLMEIVGLVYKKVSIGEVDVFDAFRVLLLSVATGTGIFSGMKAVGGWVVLNKTKKNIAITAINHLSFFRPNGAIGLFLLAVFLFVGWIFAGFYAR